MGSFRTQELSMRGDAPTQATMLTAVTPAVLVRAIRSDVSSRWWTAPFNSNPWGTRTESH